RLPRRPRCWRRSGAKRSSPGDPTQELEEIARCSPAPSATDPAPPPLPPAPPLAPLALRARGASESLSGEGGQQPTRRCARLVPVAAAVYGRDDRDEVAVEPAERRGEGGPEAVRAGDASRGAVVAEEDLAAVRGAAVARVGRGDAAVLGGRTAGIQRCARM